MPAKQCKGCVSCLNCDGVYQYEVSVHSRASDQLALGTFGFNASRMSDFRDAFRPQSDQVTSCSRKHADGGQARLPKAKQT